MIVATTGASEGVMEAGAEHAVNAARDSVTTADTRAMFIGQSDYWRVTRRRAKSLRNGTDNLINAPVSQKAYREVALQQTNGLL